VGVIDAAHQRTPFRFRFSAPEIHSGDFGAFVDIGVHQDGLVHISQLSENYVKHPTDVVSIGDIVQVKIIDVDTKKNRISLSMNFKD